MKQEKSPERRTSKLTSIQNLSQKTGSSRSPQKRSGNEDLQPVFIQPEDRILENQIKQLFRYTKELGQSITERIEGIEMQQRNMKEASDYMQLMRELALDKEMTIYFLQNFVKPQAMSKLNQGTL